MHKFGKIQLLIKNVPNCMKTIWIWVAAPNSNLGPPSSIKIYHDGKQNMAKSCGAITITFFYPRVRKKKNIAIKSISFSEIERNDHSQIKGKPHILFIALRI